VTGVQTCALPICDEAWSSIGVSEDSGCDLYVVNADGSGTPRRLTTEPGCDSNPAWSPDGTKIAFTSDRGGNLDIYAIDACCEEGDTNQSQQLTNDPPEDSDPAWSPDGTQIAFTHTAGTNADVYEMDADGSGKTRLTYSDAIEAHPTWSPDGKKIAFTREGFPGAYTGSSTGATTMMPTTGIFTMDFDGTDPALVRIFQNEIASFPEWGVTAQQDEGAEQAVEGEPTEEVTADWRALDARMPNAVVQAYIEDMNALLRGVNLRDSTIGGEEQIAQYMTASTLEGLGPSGKEEVLRFLAEAGLIDKIPLNTGLDLSGADLSGANLSGAQLSGVNLSGANLSNANLSRTYLDGANLSGAELSGANLSGAHLSAVRLDGVKFTEEQLNQTWSPTGTTMPNNSQEKAWEAIARRALTDVAAAARWCADQHGGSYAACSDVSVLFEYGLYRMPNVTYQSVPEAGTNNVLFSTEHIKGGSAFQFDPAAGSRIRAVPRF
jgi:hypothetical protein